MPRGRLRRVAARGDRVRRPLARPRFAALGVAWLLTGVAWLRMILRGRGADHRRWMLRSFSLTVAAVTLRLPDARGGPDPLLGGCGPTSTPLLRTAPSPGRAGPRAGGAARRGRVDVRSGAGQVRCSGEIFAHNPWPSDGE
ncbi:DUF2306 domain-containing protein [Streptacidiphilus anmyonensis]|uniref:DUF2306 domain-containing protein n=1 Tax=Streptacidiphilus anmyonensis TaxID=405782 RepID=UPI003F704339